MRMGFSFKYLFSFALHALSYYYNTRFFSSTPCNVLMYIVYIAYAPQRTSYIDTRRPSSVFKLRVVLYLVVERISFINVHDPSIAHNRKNLVQTRCTYAHINPGE